MKKERKDSDKNEKDNKTERRRKKKFFLMRRNEGIIKVSRGVNFFFLF